LALNGILRYITDYVDGEQCKLFVTLEQSTTTKVMGIEQLMELLRQLLTHSDQSDLESFCATIVPLLCRQLYTQLRCENFSDLSDIGRVFTSELMRLWIMLGMVNGDRILKKLCSAENPSSTELCVRMAYIFMTLLSHLGKTIGVGEAIGEQDRAVRQKLLNGTITAVGHFANIDEWCQVLTTLGWQRSVVLQLCSLPLAYFADRKLMEILLPSLISCCYRNAKAMDLLKQELSPTILITFIEENERSPADCPRAMEFSKRFPKKQWLEAREFFARS